ncbi:MAG: hypothetical protein NTU98_10070 [Bacteroidetes bacterium]|nr:hypothetical protein [Bacteroidota bacterium]
MNKSLLFIAFILLLGPGQANAQRYRWDIKTLTDTAGERVFKLKAQKETLRDLADPLVTQRPKKSEMKPGIRAHAEKRKVIITGDIIKYGREDDRDYHLVVKSPDGGQTLIAEIPDPGIPELNHHPDLAACCKECRKVIDDKLGIPTTDVKPVLRILRVKITGVVFFDQKTHGKGHAENGVEIHPVLHIEVIKEK